MARIIDRVCPCVTQRRNNKYILSLSAARELKRLTNEFQRAKSSPAAEYYNNNNNNIYSLKTLLEIKLYILYNREYYKSLSPLRRKPIKNALWQTVRTANTFSDYVCRRVFRPKCEFLVPPPVFDICWDLHTSSSTPVQLHARAASSANVLFKAPIKFSSAHSPSIFLISLADVIKCIKLLSR